MMLSLLPLIGLCAVIIPCSVARVADRSEPTHYQMLGIDTSELQNANLQKIKEDLTTRFDPLKNPDFATMWYHFEKSNTRDSKWDFMVKLCSPYSSGELCATKAILPRINEAYSVLSNTEKRRAYDEELRAERDKDDNKQPVIIAVNDKNHYKIFNLDPEGVFLTYAEFTALYEVRRHKWDVYLNRNFEKNWKKEKNEYAKGLCKNYPSPEECATLELIPRLDMAYYVLKDRTRRLNYNQAILGLQARDPSRTLTVRTSTSRRDPTQMFPESMFPDGSPAPNFPPMFNTTKIGLWIVEAAMYYSKIDIPPGFDEPDANRLPDTGRLPDDPDDADAGGSTGGGEELKKRSIVKRDEEKRLKKKLAKEWGNFLKGLPLPESSIYPSGVRVVQVQFINKIPTAQRERKLLQETSARGVQLTANIEHMSEAVEGRDMENDVKKTVQENSNKFQSKVLPGYRLDPRSVTVQEVKLLKSDDSIWNVDQTMLVVAAALVTLIISFIIIGVYIRFSRYRRVRGQTAAFVRGQTAAFNVSRRI